MRVNALDHVNIFTDDMAGSVKFYVELFDLTVKNGPSPLPPEHVQWVYDDAGRAIVHLNTHGAPQAFKRDCPAGPTGALHHVALNCSGSADMIARLDARGISHTVNDLDSIGLKQIFVFDPNQVLLELNFFEG